MSTQPAWADTLSTGDAPELDKQASTAASASEIGTAASVKDGMYTFTPSGASNLRMSVAGDSWKTGANVQLAAAGNGLGQKFYVRATSGSYYHITMALSGTAIEAQSAADNSNVKAASSDNKALQLWKARQTSDGIVFVNKASGSVLGVSGKASADASVRAVPAATDNSSTTTQAWKLTSTNARSNVKNLSVVKTLVSKAPKGGNRTVKLSAKGTGYTISKARSKQLKKALKAVWKRSANASFVMVDLDTGITVTCGADRRNHGASTFKAAYVTYLYQNYLERGRKLDGSTRSLMSQTIKQSSNEAYLSLRSRYGTAGFKKWLQTIGLGGKANNPYPTLTARQLARVWAKLYSYERSGGKYVKQWRKNYSHSYFSMTREQLGKKNTVYSKPGWYPKQAGYAALNDGAIVRHRDGRSYVLAVLSNVNCYGDRAVMRKVVKALDAIHREMPRA